MRLASLFTTLFTPIVVLAFLAAVPVQAQAQEGAAPAATTTPAATPAPAAQESAFEKERSTALRVLDAVIVRTEDAKSCVKAAKNAGDLHTCKEQLDKAREAAKSRP